jgi:hypothetical protein
MNPIHKSKHRFQNRIFLTITACLLSCVLVITILYNSNASNKKKYIIDSENDICLSNVANKGSAEINYLVILRCQNIEMCSDGDFDCISKEALIEPIVIDTCTEIKIDKDNSIKKFTLTLNPKFLCNLLNFNISNKGSKEIVVDYSDISLIEVVEK